MKDFIIFTASRLVFAFFFKHFSKTGTLPVIERSRRLCVCLNFLCWIIRHSIPVPVIVVVFAAS